MTFTSYIPPRYANIDNAVKTDKYNFRSLYESNPYLLEICNTCKRIRGHHYSGNCNNRNGDNPYPLSIVLINPNTTVL